MGGSQNVIYEIKLWGQLEIKMFQLIFNVKEFEGKLRIGKKNMDVI